jgi:XTP/dITP diphosphohydrolase
MELLFGSFNQGKVREIQAFLGSDFTVRTCADFTGIAEADETGSTLPENARIKAVAYHAATGLPCFADDSGLEVDALSGAPGVHSAYYAGPQKSPSDNIAKLLTELQGVANRAAHFRTVIVYVDQAGTEQVFEGVLRGVITQAPRGGGGFGYDPVFELPMLGKTLAELSLEHKNSISHRGVALAKLKAFLQTVSRKA